MPVVHQVVQKFVLQLEAQLADRGVTFDLSPEAIAWLAEKGYDERMGARPLGRVIQEHIKKPLADEVLFGKLKKGGTVRVTVETKEDGKTGLKLESLADELPVQAEEGRARADGAGKPTAKQAAAAETGARRPAGAGAQAAAAMPRKDGAERRPGAANLPAQRRPLRRLILEAAWRSGRRPAAFVVLITRPHAGQAAVEPTMPIAAGHSARRARRRSCDAARSAQNGRRHSRTVDG